MIVALLQNMALLISLVVLYQFIFQKWSGQDWSSRMASGILFGAGAIVSMMTPFIFQEGVVLDGRSIILSVAGFFGGPLVAIIAAVIAAGYRISMGGAGMVVGVMVIFSSAAIGVVFHYWRRRTTAADGIVALWTFGMIVHLVVVVLLLFVPQVGGDLVRTAGLHIIILFPLATLIVCRIFLDRERHIEAERQLYQSEEFHRTTLISIGDAVISTDAQCNIVFLNPLAETLTGWKQAEAKGRPLETVCDLISEDSGEEVSNPAETVLREGKSIGLANHTLLIKRDGTRLPIADSAAPIRNRDGGITGVVLVFRDQSAEREAERALRESERRLATLMSNLPGMVYRSCNNQQWTPEFVSEGCRELTGFSANDILSGRLNGFADLVHPDDLQLVSEETGKAVQAKRSFLLHYRLITSDGAVKNVEERGRPVLDSTNEVEALEGFILDISDRESAERERERLEEELRHALKMEAVGRLAGGVAHDFNNMLAIINGYTELAIDEIRGNTTAEKHLSTVKEAGRKSAELTRQLLTFARKQPIQPVTVDLNNVLAERMPMLERLIGEAIRFTWKPGKNPGTINIDLAQLDQVLINLIINARHAIGSNGTITVATHSREITDASELTSPSAELKAGKYAVLSIGDTGCGIADETLPHIFEPFFTTKPTGEGTGLGLATVYGILSQNNAAVTVDSSPEKGTTFHLYFPVAAPQAAPDPSPASLDNATPCGSETILLVEDEPSILDLARMSLEKLEYHVLTAQNPHEALHIATEYDRRIDLLITDVIMPEMNGHELWRKINENRPLPCLYISGYTANIIHQRGLLIENAHFLEKPFSLSALAQKVREALASRSCNEPG